MGLFSPPDSYDRTRILDAAARARRRPKRAIALYRRVLAVEPQNAELHARLARLLSETGHAFDAWIHYRTAARCWTREERFDRAAGLYREASQRLPTNPEVWIERAELERRRGRGRDAVRVLLEGRAGFRARRWRPQAIHLLRRARNLEPRCLDLLLDLARLLARTQQAPEALLVLERAEKSCTGPGLRRVRAARFRITHRLVDLWRLIRTPARAAGEPGVRLRPLVTSGAGSRGL